MFERLIFTLVVVAGVALLTFAYFSSDRLLKIAGAFVLLFVWFIAYDIVTAG